MASAPVTAPPELPEVARITPWLAAHVSGFEGPVTVEPLRGGQSNPTFKLETPSRSYLMGCMPGPAATLCSGGGTRNAAAQGIR